MTSNSFKWENDLVEIGWTAAPVEEAANMIAKKIDEAMEREGATADEKAAEIYPLLSDIAQLSKMAGHIIIEASPTAATGFRYYPASEIIEAVR